jgi:hypothetical protein
MHGELTTAEIQDATALTQNGVYFLMANVQQAGIALYKPAVGRWAVLPPFDVDRQLKKI